MPLSFCCSLFAATNIYETDYMQYTKENCDMLMKLRRFIFSSRVISMEISCLPRKANKFAVRVSHLHSVFVELMS